MEIRTIEIPQEPSNAWTEDEIDFKNSDFLFFIYLFLGHSIPKIHCGVRNCQFDNCPPGNLTFSTIDAISQLPHPLFGYHFYIFWFTDTSDCSCLLLQLTFIATNHPFPHLPHIIKFYQRPNMNSSANETV